MIGREELTGYIDTALAGLKDFQTSSVEALYSRLYGEDQPCMLLADEVGLGKTVVARGLIARVLQRRIEEGRRRPFKVTYICSNQVIAQENIRKLNLFPKELGMKAPVSRIAYLAWADVGLGGEDGQRLLELNTLTPATSFRLTSGIGNKWERRIIYAALCQDRKMWNRRAGLRWMLKGTCVMKNYRQQLDAALDWDLRENLPADFIAAMKRERVSDDAGAVNTVLPGHRSYSLYEAVLMFAERVDGRTWRGFWDGCQSLARRLRECLVGCCLRYVDADLYILDEFQRFRDLIDGDCSSDEAILAQKIFFGHRKNTRILLLSATPFKAFTGYDDVERGEDHYRDFRRVLKFLLRGDEVALGRYDHHRQALYRQIIDLRDGDIGDVSPKHREEVENVLRSVMCRTERHSVAADPSALIADVWKDRDQQIPFETGDIENFRRTDQLARALEKVGYAASKPVDFCKSAAYPLSFLDRYRLKEELRKHMGQQEISRALGASKDAWLDMEAVDRYQWRDPESAETRRRTPANARLENLIGHAVGEHGHKLLWVPPSLPYYQLEDAFAGAEGFSKTLLFSSWIMVPRMVSTLVSYEVERRTVGNTATRDGQEAEPRTYFTPEGKRRHPVPLIRYARRFQGGQSQLSNMSNFTLLYPSQTLAEIIDPIGNLGSGRALDDLRKQVADEFRRRMESLDLRRFETAGGEGERWYWAAPLLLDRESESAKTNVERWFQERAERADDQEGESFAEEEKGAKKEHFDLLEPYFNDPAAIGLGSPPDDLPEIVADIALGSPAVLALRSLRRLFPAVEEAGQLHRATAVADEFCSLFNKPESIAAIRLSEVHRWFWRAVTDYCASGCLQAVLDEYFHLLKGQHVSPDGAVSQLVEAININASVINVDSLETFMDGTPRKMRCHYATEFGSQRIETDEGQKRASNLREVFNSPFRPFLLSTTSIGQEGLDFHHYCRRIVHWNLPGNPVDLEQREGRINRFKSLVIRQRVAKIYGGALGREDFEIGQDLWERLFKIADREERQATGKCELIPFWHLDAGGDICIERVIPLYPFSADRGRLDHILKTLAIYRLAFGQPRQAELVDHLLGRNFTPEQIETITDALMIDLSPINYNEVPCPETNTRRN